MQRWFGDKAVLVCAEFEFNLSTLHFGISQRNRRASLDQGLMATWNQLPLPFPVGILDLNSKHLASGLHLPELPAAADQLCGSHAVFLEHDLHCQPILGPPERHGVQG